MAAGIVLVLCAGVLSFAVTLFVRRHAVGLGLVAKPNDRSSHVAPTPTGGGLGIVAGGTLAAASLVWFLPGWAFVVVVLSLAVAFIGFLDDRKPVPAKLRLVAQIVLVSLLVYALGAASLAPAIVPGGSVFLVIPLAVLALVYWVNLFNFMDGIDGIAGTQATFMFGAAVWLALDAGAPMGAELWWFAATGAATFGFLMLNWPPAKIFMGDAGSTYLAFVLGLAALVTMSMGVLSLPQWLILSAVFVTDATVTLLRRLLQRERIFEAHRRHAYQRLSRWLGSHLPVTSAVAAINIVAMLPLAWWAGADPRSAWVAVAWAYGPLVLVVVLAGAGAPEEKRDLAVTPPPEV